MSNEFSQRPVWKPMGSCQVSSELFLDVVFTSVCDCVCPYCIARTKTYAPENRAAWEQAVQDAFRLFDIRDVIILGGEATLDPAFFSKLEFLTKAAETRPIDQLILTTNGIRLRDEQFLSGLLHSRVHAVNLSRMHDSQGENDRLFGRNTLTKQEIKTLYHTLRKHGKTLRINVNIWRGNLDTPDAMNRFVSTFSGCCDAIKFTPLMATDLFDTCQEVTDFTRANAIPETEIAALWEAFLQFHGIRRRAEQVLGYVDYAETEAFGQKVILKYAQVEDKYDRNTMIPTLKLYPNGCLSNEWSFTRDIRERIKTI